MDTEKKKIFDDFVLKTIFVFNAQQKLSGNTFFFPEIDAFDWCAWKDDRERDLAIQTVTALCLKNCLTYFMFSSEAWVSSYSAEEMEAVKRSGGVPRPSQDPKRKEVAICTYVAKDETFASYAPIIDVLGKRLLGEWQDFSGKDGEAKSAWQECFV